MSAAPRDSVAEAAREHGWDLVRQGRNAEALAAWASIVREKPGTVQAQKALFDIAVHTMETSGDRAAAARWYRAAAATNPDDRALHARARLWETELAFYAENLDPTDGLAMLEALGEEWAGQDEQGLAWLRISQYYRDRHDEANLVRWYDRAISAHPQAPYVPFAMLTRAEELLNLSQSADHTDVARGVQELNRLLNWSDEYGPTSLANEALFLLGKVHADQGEWEEARSWYLLLAGRDRDGEWGGHGEREAARCSLRLGHAGDAMTLCARLLTRLDTANWVRSGEEPVWRRDVAELISQARTVVTHPRDRSVIWTPLQEEQAAETKGAWPGNGWTAQTQVGCGGGCVPYNDPNLVFFSRKAINISYRDCVTGYFWQSCNQNKTVYCARWCYYMSADCSGTQYLGSCLAPVLAYDGTTTCP